MIRDIERLGAEILDVLVVGGGIHGATAAYHAARKGYRTAVVDKGDFCCATSANSLKILHGGLRYLQHGNVKRMRQSIMSRREMMRLAPYLVQPLPCMMPLYGSGLRGRAAMRAALLANDIVSWDRNQGLPEEIQLPPGHLVSEEKCREIIPGIDPNNLRGGAVWHDVLALDTERLVIEYIMAAVEHGAQAANYANVTAVDEVEKDLYTVTVENLLDRRPHTVRARYIINAAGPWFEESVFSRNGKGKRKQQWALALNIVSQKKIFDDYAVALEGQAAYRDRDAIVRRDTRLYFFVPWRDCTMIGTEYIPSGSGPDTLAVTREIIQNMVDEINAMYPEAKLAYGDITFYHAGLLPMRADSEPGSVQLEKNSTITGDGTTAMSRVLTVKSVKYTTAPHVAREVLRHLGARLKPSGETIRKVPARNELEQGEAGTAVQGLLEKRYGPRGRRINSYLDRDTPGDIWVDQAAQLLKAEVEYLAAEEMACTLPDIVFRRTGLGTAACPPLNTLRKAAAYMGRILGWDGAREEREVEEVLRRYAPLLS